MSERLSEGSVLLRHNYILFPTSLYMQVTLHMGITHKPSEDFLKIPGTLNLQLIYRKVIRACRGECKIIFLIKKLQGSIVRNELYRKYLNDVQKKLIYYSTCCLTYKNYDPVYMVPDPHGHDIILDSFYTNVALKFTIISQNLITANHRKNGESKYDRKLAEIDVVTT